MSIGIPIKILHEAEGHIITCETVDGKCTNPEINLNSSNSHNTIFIYKYLT